MHFCHCLSNYFLSREESRWEYNTHIHSKFWLIDPYFIWIKRYTCTETNPWSFALFCCVIIYIVTINRAWNQSASFRLTQWLKIISHMIRSYYRCCCINEPVIFSHCVHLKLGHWFHAPWKVCSDCDDIVPLKEMYRIGKQPHKSDFDTVNNFVLSL